MAAYLKLGDIKGESAEANHKDWILLIDSIHTVRRPAQSSLAGGSARAGSVNVEPIVLSKQLDKSTPKIAEAVCKGDGIKEAEIHFCRDDGKHQPYYEVKLKDVKIENYTVTAFGAGEKPDTETVTLRFSEIEWTYTPFKDGKPEAPIKTKYNVPGHSV